MVTVLFTDLVGSTELLQRLGDDAAEELRQVHLSLARRALTAAGGDEVKTLGDGLMAVFGSPVQAAGCAVEVRRAIEEHNRNQAPGHDLHLRVGLRWPWASSPPRSGGQWLRGRGSAPCSS